MRVSHTLVEAAAVALGFLLLAVVFTWPVAAHLTTALPGDLGDPLLNAWILAWDADRLADGLVGLWQAPIFHPYANTLAYSEHLLGVAVPLAPVHWVFDNLLLTYNVAFLASFMLAGGGMYLLVRSLTGSRAAGLLAGIAFAFSPYRVNHVSHLQVLMSGWMPIGLWALHRYGRTSSRWALAGFVGAIVMQGLSNGYYLYFLGVPVAFVAGWLLWRAGRRRARVLAELSVAALVIGIVFAPIAFVYYEARQSQSLVRDISEIDFYSADIAHYLEVDRDLRFWGGRLREGRPERALFPGATLASLALVALGGAVVARSGDARATAGGSRSLVWLYASIAVAAMALSLGPEPRAWGTPLLPVGPYRLGMTLVPGLDGLRVPARLAMVVYLALSVLAGLALARIGRIWPRRARALAAGGLAILVFLESLAVPVAVEELEERPFDDAVYQWLTDRPPGAVLELPVEGRHRNLQTLHTLGYQYRTLEHGHPLVNGFSGYTTALFDFLPVAPLWNRAVTGQMLEGLRAIGVRYVIVHEALYQDRDLARATLRALRAERAGMAGFYGVGPTHVFDLGEVEWPYRLPPDEPQLVGAVPVPPTALRLSASHQPGQLGLAVDGDVDTAWTTGEPQRGSESLTLRFDRSREVTGVRIRLAGGTWGDYPRRLRIEGSAGGEAFDLHLHEDVVLPALIASFPRGDRNPAVDIVFPPARVTALRLRQLGSSEPWRWSINELTVWERPGAQ